MISDVDRARIALEESQTELRIAHSRRDDMHEGVTGASRSLSAAERALRDDDPVDAAHRMDLVAKGCQAAADDGVSIATSLRNAGVEIDAAQRYADRVETTDMDGLDAAGFADLKARIDAYGQAIDLARPMATAAAEHLYSAAALSARAAEIDIDGLDHAIDVAATVAAVGRDIGSAHEGGRNLADAVDHASVAAERSMANPEMQLSIAHERQQEYDHHLMDLLDAASDPRDWSEALAISIDQGDDRPLRELETHAEALRERMASHAQDHHPAPSGAPGGPDARGQRR